MRDALRLNQHSYRTEEAYVGWITRYVLFHDKRHSSDMGPPEVEAFITQLAVEEHVVASTQHQGFSALLFPCHEVPHQDLGPVDALRAKRPRRLPAALTQEETRRLLGQFSATHGVMARLLYGGGLRLMECLRLRVEDLEFEPRAIVVRGGKGEQDGVTVLPDSLIPVL